MLQDVSTRFPVGDERHHPHSRVATGTEPSTQNPYRPNRPVNFRAGSGTAAPDGEGTRTHIEQCEECRWVFNRLMTKTGDEVVIDYVYETREALRQMWGPAEKGVAEFREQFAAIRRTQW